MSELVIAYISRGSKDGIARVPGDDIASLGRSFITLKDGTMLPYHHLIRIDDKTGRLWSRTLKDVDIEDHHVL